MVSAGVWEYVIIWDNPPAAEKPTADKYSDAAVGIRPSGLKRGEQVGVTTSVHMGTRYYWSRLCYLDYFIPSPALVSAQVYAAYSEVDKLARGREKEGAYETLISIYRDFDLYGKQGKRLIFVSPDKSRALCNLNDEAILFEDGKGFAGCLGWTFDGGAFYRWAGDSRYCAFSLYNSEPMDTLMVWDTNKMVITAVLNGVSEYEFSSNYLIFATEQLYEPTKGTPANRAELKIIKALDLKTRSIISVLEPDVARIKTKGSTGSVRLVPSARCPTACKRSALFDKYDGYVQKWAFP